MAGATSEAWPAAPLWDALEQKPDDELAPLAGRLGRLYDRVHARMAAEEEETLVNRASEWAAEEEEGLYEMEP